MLTTTQLLSYNKDGFIVLDNVFSEEEMNQCSSEYDRIFEHHSNSELEATWQGDWRGSVKEHVYF